MENYESCYFINLLYLFIINYVLVFYVNVAISFDIFPVMIITFVKVFSQFRNLKIFVHLSKESLSTRHYESFYFWNYFHAFYHLRNEALEMPNLSIYQRYQLENFSFKCFRFFCVTLYEFLIIPDHTIETTIDVDKVGEPQVALKSEGQS